MKRFLELFESLNEWVYVADMDTYELFYMNECLREIYGFSSEEEYKGKKCYEVLQGKKEPCIFCTNSLLKAGEFYEWTYKNPIMKKDALLKDTMFHEDGKRYRLEIAFDTTGEAKETDKEERMLAYGESMINECLRRVFSINDPSEALDEVLSFMGEHFRCDRVYIFENEDDDTVISNTYEWCSDGVMPQKDLLQKEPIETVAVWYAMFKDDKPAIIADMENIRYKHPELYAALKPQNIDSLVTVPLQHQGKVIGFLGVDNPIGQNLNVLVHFLFVIGHFISGMIERRNLISTLRYRSYHDQLTGLLNRHAFLETIEKSDMIEPVGVIYSDISGLKNINDTLGHLEGDRHILRWRDIIVHFFGDDEIFRVGGDELVVICKGIKKSDFEIKVKNLRDAIKEEDYHLSVGSAWGQDEYENILILLQKAEKDMYKDKQDYYNKREFGLEAGNLKDDDNVKTVGNKEVFVHSVAEESLMYQYVKSNYFDIETMFKSITVESAPYYLYFGDLQTKWFYVSDNMKERFGFNSNMVFDMISIWEKRISNNEELLLYRKDIENVMLKKQPHHDLRYRVKDKDGNDIWIRCCGIVQWSKDGTTPLFFSGFISYQESGFVVDPVTNFPREYAATVKLTEMRENFQKVMIVGFALNNFSEINELRGRHKSDMMLKNIGEVLVSHFEDKLTFYRLDGVRFMAIVSRACDESVEDIITQLREIVDALYRKNNIAVRVPCSVCVFSEEATEMSPQDIIVNIISLLTEAKHLPDREYVVHSKKSVQVQKEHAQMVMELGESVLNDFSGFRIVVQPVVSSAGGNIVSGEALLRWRFNDKDIPPFVFIPILEKNKLIVPVGKWVLEQVIRACRRFIMYKPEFRMAFNVSYHQILDEDFIPFMKRTLEKYNLSGKNLIMELTETHFDETPEKLENFIFHCKELGIDVALDDFGNGYSSLGLLMKYPANIIKLDKTLLNSITNSEDNINFISAIVYACHKFGKKVCAEGVETEEELSIVRETGCDMIQGYYFYKPLELKDLYEALIEKDMKKEEI